MSDSFGSGQQRVLTVRDRNLDNVVFQNKRPPLTSEWNLINQIGNEKLQNIAKVSLPSGWLYPNETLQNWNEIDAQTGQVLCSENYFANSLKLISRDNNIAIVNGWPLLIQFVDDTIYLNEPEGQMYDFVFLEVWRKLVGPQDYIYPYGNVHQNPYSDNEIEWDTIGTETTKRVQIQYRIRSVQASAVYTDNTREVFDLEDIYPIGGRIDGIANLYKFNICGASDPGLYVSGDGSNDSKTYLNTVDGYVYAIPMFIAYRRSLSDDLFTATEMNRSYVNLNRLAEGYRSDRPDIKIVDSVYKEDIVDLRHRIIVPGNDIKDILNNTISKLLVGDLTTALKKGFGENGAITTASSGGSTLMKVERINSIGGDDIPDIGDGSDIISTAFKRRAFCNAEITHDHNIVEIGDTGAWVEGTFSIASKVTLPDGEIVSVDGFYSPDQGLVTGVTSDGTDITIADTGSYSIVGTTNRLYMEFTFKYSSSSYGFKDVPKEFIEISKNNDLPIATRDNTIPLRFNKLGELLNFGLNPNNYDVTENDFIKYRGGIYTENTNFGHELVIYRTTNTSGLVTLELNDGKYCGYYILGVKSVELSSSSGDYIEFVAERDIVTSPTYSIQNYIIEVTGQSNKEVIITLYTGSKYINDVGDDYSVQDSMKFFDLSKQGRGVIDCFELIDAIAVEEGATGTYTIDTGDKPIIAIATMMLSVSGYAEGFPRAYRFNTSGDFIPITTSYINQSLPVLNSNSYTADLLPTMIKVQANAGEGKLRVPLLVHSYVAQNESPYNFYYKTNAYQGILNSSATIYGKVISEGPALITTLGSGAIKNYTYLQGTASFTLGSRTVTGQNTKWSSYVKEGDYIRKTGASFLYRIIEINSDTEIILSETYVGDTELSITYEINRIDIPNSINSNMVDRLPSLKIITAGDEITDYNCFSNEIELRSENGDSFIVDALRKLQDPINAISNDFIVGSSALAKRGRNNFKLSSSGNNLIYKIGDSRPFVVYESVSGLLSGQNKKVYQFYLFVRSGKEYVSGDPNGMPDNMGKAYLMVISGETVDNNKNTLNPYSDRDTVDLYELIGRPIIK